LLPAQGGDEEAETEPAPLTADERAEAEENSKAAHVWISGIEAFKDHLGLEAVYDLSATPFFLSGSGYGEGKLFPWVVSDFGLMDAIESGIVKVPRLPVVDDAIKGDLPKFRDVYNVIREENPRAFPMRGRRTGGAAADPSRLPHHLLEAALKDALYKHYAEVFAKWEAQPELGRPPVFIVVCKQHCHIEAHLRLDFRLRGDRRRRRQKNDTNRRREIASVLECRERPLALTLPHLPDRFLAA